MLVRAAFGIVLLTMLPTLGLAQQAPAPAAASAQALPPDVVRLKNGGMVRGTILEIVPDAHVQIRSATGELRQYPMKDVLYAGAAANDPAVAPQPAGAVPPGSAAAPGSAPAPGTAPGPGSSPAPGSAAAGAYPPPNAAPEPTKEPIRPAIVVHGAPARIQFESDPQGLTLWKRGALAVSGLDDSSGVGRATGYDEVCTAPCEASVVAGTHTLAVSKTGDRVVEAQPLTIPQGNSRVHAKLIQRSGARKAGYVLMVGGAIAGVVMSAVALSGESCTTDDITLRESCSTDPNLGLLGFGMGITLASVLGGMALTRTRDRVELTITPGPVATAPRLQLAGLRSDPRQDRLSAPGLNVTLSY